MGKDSAILWTDHTFNPWWGCVKVSPGCDNCYAETWARRKGHDVWGKDAPRRFFGDKHWNDPLRWNRSAQKRGVRERVFCASMGDVFEHNHDLIQPRVRLFELIHQTPNLIWLLLTKRPHDIEVALFHGAGRGAIPDNVFLMTTVETNKYTWRMESLEKLGQPYGISVEPMLGPLNIPDRRQGTPMRFRPAWVICGGESGPGFRAPDPAWVRHLRDQCVERSIPFFFKQWGGLRPSSNGRVLDGREWLQTPWDNGRL